MQNRNRLLTGLLVLVLMVTAFLLAISSGDEYTAIIASSLVTLLLIALPSLYVKNTNKVKKNEI